MQIAPHVSAAIVEQQGDRPKDAIEKRLEARRELSGASIEGGRWRTALPV
jgi:hypothetical protein